MADQYNQGMFLPTTQVWDVSEVYSTEVTSPEFKELLVRLYQNMNKMATIINMKDSALYNNSEFINGQLFFKDPLLDSTTTTTATLRQVFRKVINFGALPNTGTANALHGITTTAATTFTRIYGTASDTTAMAYVPLPYAATTGAADCIELWVDATKVYVRTGAAWPATYNKTYIILEYLKQ